MSYPRPWLNYQQLLQKLIDKGLQVTDPQKAEDFLDKVGFYRLSGYWNAFRERSGLCCPLQPLPGRRKFKRGDVDKLVLPQFKPGASFQNAVDLYVFDKRLRFLVLDALERIEVSLRHNVSHTLGALSPTAHLQSEFLFEGFAKEPDSKTGLTEHHQWQSRQAALVSRSREAFIVHHKDKYGYPIPIWVACEVWDFGCLARLYSGMRPQEQDLIAQKYGIANGRVFATWLRSLNYLRNVCAHHGRLWNRNIVVLPKLPEEQQVIWTRYFKQQQGMRKRPFLLLCVIQHMMRAIHPRSKWAERLKTLLMEFPDLSHLELNLYGMGVPDDWLDWTELWSEQRHDAGD